ncbi:hypothetical protein FRB94_012940 [Tulasnella sp. JGI-2019a]|nr:hypothetical protein FRB94_012940 [Tulasnella sp. JGI-2019a]
MPSPSKGPMIGGIVGGVVSSILILGLLAVCFRSYRSRHNGSQLQRDGPGVLSDLENDDRGDIAPTTAIIVHSLPSISQAEPEAHNVQPTESVTRSSETNGIDTPQVTTPAPSAPLTATASAATGDSPMAIGVRPLVQSQPEIL